MAESVLKQAAGKASSAVRVGAIDDRTIMRLKCWTPGTHGASAPVVSGATLPAQVGETLSGSTRVLCVRPSEWLLVSQESAASLRGELEPELSQHNLVLVDWSEALATLEVRGPAARELLSKGCGLDLHPRAFPANRCARTRLAQIPVVVDCVETSAKFELYMARSYSRYLYSWLVDAAVEFGDPLT